MIQPGYIPEGFVSNNADAKTKLSIYPEAEGPHGANTITIMAEPIAMNSLEIPNVLDYESTTLGRYNARILTTYWNGGSTNYDIILLDEQGGYRLVIYGIQSSLSLDELKKIAEELSYTPDIANPIHLSNADLTINASINNTTPTPAPEIPADKFHQIGAVFQDVAAKHADQFTSGFSIYDSETSAAMINRINIEHTVNHTSITDTLPDLDRSQGYWDEHLEEFLSNDGTLENFQNTYSIQDPDTGNLKPRTEEYKQVFAEVEFTLTNPTDKPVLDYCFSISPKVLKNENGHLFIKETSSFTYSEPVYLSFTDHTGKSSYMMDFDPGESRTITALYTVSEPELENYYLCFNVTGSDSNWNQYVKLI